MKTASDDEESADAISIGWVFDGSTVASRLWDTAIKNLALCLPRVATGIETPLNLNVVFHVPGNMLKPEFVGIRTGRYSKKEARLMVQVAVPEVVPPDPMTYLKEAVREAIAEAERWAAKRKVPIDVLKLCDILEGA